MFIPIEKDPEIELEQFQGIIVGGRNAWHAKLKQYLPNTWRYIHPDDNIDISSISADIIFFATDYLSHAAYYAVIGEQEGSKFHRVYISH